MEKQGKEFDLGDLARAIVGIHGPQILYSISHDDDFIKSIRLVLEAVPDIVGRALAEFDEHRVEWPGFGSFALEARGPRKGRNFVTKEQVDIPARDKIVFNTSPLLAEKVENITGRETY